MGFFSRLESRAREIDSLLCIGLDPHLDQLSTREPQSALDFCKSIIESTADITLAYKPNSAFFEFFGSEGIEVLENVIEFIPDDIPVILDGKRGDIASSAAAYAVAIFETLNADAATINPYLGYDSLAPFLQNEDRGIFLLCKTSNPGSRDLQELALRRSSLDTDASPFQMLYEMVANRAVEWNVKDNLGLVVGATQIEPLYRARQIASDLWFLAPGIGAQGGDLGLALQAGLREDGFGMVFPVSRGISKSINPRQAAIDLNDRINQYRKNLGDRGKQFRSSNGTDSGEQKLAVEILKSGCVKFGEFTLKSGIKSPIYIDLRRLTGFPELLDQVGVAFTKILGKLEFDHLAGLPYAGLPIATAISLIGGWPLVYPRKESKSYGTQVEVEGVFQEGEQVVLIDDLATTGGSKFEAIEKLRSVGLKVNDVVVLIDRESGAAEDLSESGYQLHAIFTLSQLLRIWLSEGLITDQQMERVENFLNEAGKVI